MDIQLPIMSGLDATREIKLEAIINNPSTTRETSHQIPQPIPCHLNACPILSGQPLTRVAQGLTHWKEAQGTNKPVDNQGPHQSSGLSRGEVHCFPADVTRLVPHSLAFSSLEA